MVMKKPISYYKLEITLFVLYATLFTIGYLVFFVKKREFRFPLFILYTQSH